MVTRISFTILQYFFMEICTEEDKIDILINNAGVICHPHEKTSDGNESHFQVNYLGMFVAEYKLDISQLLSYLIMYINNNTFLL